MTPTPEHTEGILVHLKKRIQNTPMEPPSDLTLEQLNVWMQGAAKVYANIMKILDEIITNSRRS